MSTAHPQDSNPGKSKRLNWVALAAAVVLAFVVTKACQPEPKPTMDEVKESILAETTTPSATEKPSTNTTPSTTEKDAMPWLKSQFGAEPGEVLAQNPALWYGYVAGAYVEGSRLHVQLQVDRKAAWLWERPGGGPLKLPGAKSWFSGAVDRCMAADSDFPRITPHGLRHVAAGLMISAGANVLAVSRQLGHADPSITLRVYAALFDEDLDAVARAVEDVATAAG